MRNVFGWSTVLFGCLAMTAWAQEVRRDDDARQPGVQRERAGQVERAPGRAGERVPGAPGRGLAARGDASQSDQQIAALIYAGCRNHIEIAKFAQDRLTNPQAKEFAEKMVNDHSPGCEKMKELAGNLASAQPRGGAFDRDVPGAAPGVRPGARPGAAPGRPGARPEGGARLEADEADTPAEARREERLERREERREAIRDAVPGGVEVDVQPGARPGVAVRAGQAGAAGELNWTSIHQQIADQCLNSLKQELEQIPEGELDKAYMGHECMVHLKTIDELTVLKNHASPMLQGEIEKSIQMAKQHLQEAKQIKEQLKGSESGTPRVSRGKTTTPDANKTKKE